MKSARVIVVSDRVVDGDREDIAGPIAAERLRESGLDCPEPIHVREGRDDLRARLEEGIDSGDCVMVTLGGTGTRPGNYTPEVSTDLCDVRLTGLETQILMKGLESTPRAGLSRGIVGLTQRGVGGTLIINAPNTMGGVKDSLGVVLPLLPHIVED